MVCIIEYGSAFQIGQSKNNYVKMIKMKLIMDEEDDEDDIVKVNKKRCVKKEERNLRFLIYFI